MALVESESVCSSTRSSSQCGSTIHHQIFKTDAAALPSFHQVGPSTRARDDDEFDDVKIASELDGLNVEGIEAWEALGCIQALGAGFPGCPRASQDSAAQFPRLSLDGLERSHPIEDAPAVKEPRPFHKWIRSLHRRAPQPDGLERAASPMPWHQPHHNGQDSLFSTTSPRKSSFGSSFGFVEAVKSASMSIASVSIGNRSRMHATRSRAYSKTDRSSRASRNGPRCSEDSSCPERPSAIDPAAIERSLQRRRILEELISTEESYIGDIRFLMNVYVTILASLPSLPVGLRSSINQNLAEIIELHEEILGDLHRAVPHSEYTQPELTDSVRLSAVHGHHRWRSLDSVPENTEGRPWLDQVTGITADTQTAADVANVFGKQMNRLFIYKEYGAKYEMMIRDVATANRAMPQWDSYQKGLEVLAASLGSAKMSVDRSRKSLTIGDLLVKPIQRICKYPLLFAELLKYTPVSDCPNSHMEVENVLFRLREATAEINRATNDVRMKETLEKTWLLQDRLVFPNQRLDAVTKNRVRAFGHIQLCGVLHVCWQTKGGVEGQYFIALLYPDIFCLASAGRVDQIYTIHVCINLADLRVEEVDNGRGLQCHTAPFSWKIVFECDHQLYEFITTVCSPKEELEWRSRLSRSSRRDGILQGDTNLFSSLTLNIKSLGTVFGKPGTIARRISIHRATTVGPKSPLCQVILKNTCLMKETASTSPTASCINRSQSLLATTTSRIPVLAPARSERARLEALLSGVWSRETLPFPGMTTRSRSEHLVRASASSMMRKLSVASIASSFARRSSSMSNMHKVLATVEVDEDEAKVRSVSATDRAVTTSGHSAMDISEVVMRRLALTQDCTEIDDLLSRSPSPCPRGLSVVPSPSPSLSLGVGPGPSPTPGFEITDTKGAVRGLLLLRGEGLRSADGPIPTVKAAWRSTSGAAQSLRSSSQNSVKLSRQVSAASAASPSPSEKENMCRTPQALTPRTISRSGVRWARTGARKSDGMVQGIRNLFR